MVHHGMVSATLAALIPGHVSILVPFGDMSLLHLATEDALRLFTLMSVFLDLHLLFFPRSTARLGAQRRFRFL